jgi:hypothetical protein
MKYGAIGGLAAMALVAGCEMERPVAYQQPPADSYQLATHDLRTGDLTTPVQAATVTPGFFGATGVRPLLGRLIIDADHGRSSKLRVAVLNHQLWVEQFASAPDTVGRQITVDGAAVVIVGVAPKGFDVPAGAMLWMTAPR